MPTLRTYNGSNANHTFAQSIGIYFTVNSTITVTDLGAFAGGGVGPASGVTITTSLVLRSQSTTLLGQTTFTNASPGTVDATNRIMTKSITPAVLVPGDYCVWSSGYAATYQAYNSTQPTPGSSPVTSTLSGALTIGNDFYGASTTMPTTDGTTTKFGGPTFIATVGTIGGSLETLNVSSLYIGF